MSGFFGDIILSFGDIILSFGDIILSFGDIILSFGDIFVFFGDILLSFGVIFVLLISEIVIIRQVEQPIRYRPPQANLVTIRAKANRLTLFNKKTADYEKITLNLQPSNSFTCKCTQDDDSQTT